MYLTGYVKSGATKYSVRGMFISVRSHVILSYIVCIHPQANADKGYQALTVPEDFRKMMPPFIPLVSLKTCMSGHS